MRISGTYNLATWRLKAKLSSTLLLAGFGGALILYQNCARTGIKHIDGPSTTVQTGDLEGILELPELLILSQNPRRSRATLMGTAKETLLPEYKAVVRLEVFDLGTQSQLCSVEGRADGEASADPGHGFQVSCDFDGVHPNLVATLSARASGASDYLTLDTREFRGE